MINTVVEKTFHNMDIPTKYYYNSFHNPKTIASQQMDLNGDWPTLPGTCHTLHLDNLSIIMTIVVESDNNINPT